MSQHNGNCRMIAFYWYVLCICILLSWHANDVMFLSAKPILGRKRITLPEPQLLRNLRKIFRFKNTKV